MRFQFYYYFVVVIAYYCINVWPDHLGASIHGCRRTGRHLVALESDTLIFNAVLQPLTATGGSDDSLAKKKRKAPEGKTAAARVPKRVAKNRICT